METIKTKTKHGWVYHFKTQCKICHKSILAPKYSFLKNGFAFCSNACSAHHTHLLRDPKGSNILRDSSTPNFYYLIGLIATDGFVGWYDPMERFSKHGYSVRIELQEQDKKLLENIQDLFGGKILNTHNETECCWYLNNKRFVEYLRDTVGITKNKSRTLDVTKWFNTLNEEAKYFFIRGVIDGDGCIICKPEEYTQKRVTKKYGPRTTNSLRMYISFNICSASFSFIKMLESYMASFKPKIIKVKKKKFWIIYLTGRYNILSFLKNIIKSDKYLGLQRKIDTVEKIRDYLKSENKQKFILNEWRKGQ